MARRASGRLVARGDHQPRRPGVDFNEVFVPVVNATLRTLLLAVADLHIDMQDWDSA